MVRTRIQILLVLCVVVCYFIYLDNPLGLPRGSSRELEDAKSLVVDTAVDVLAYSMTFLTDRMSNILHRAKLISSWNV